MSQQQHQMQPSAMPPAEEIAEAFACFDHAGAGSIDAKHVATALRFLDVPVTDAEAAALAPPAAGRVTLAAFTEAVRAAAAVPRASPAALVAAACAALGPDAASVRVGALRDALAAAGPCAVDGDDADEALLQHVDVRPDGHADAAALAAALDAGRG